MFLYSFVFLSCDVLCIPPCDILLYSHLVMSFVFPSCDILLYSHLGISFVFSPCDILLYSHLVMSFVSPPCDILFTAFSRVRSELYKGQGECSDSDSFDHINKAYSLYLKNHHIKKYFSQRVTNILDTFYMKNNIFFSY